MSRYEIRLKYPRPVEGDSAFERRIFAAAGEVGFEDPTGDWFLYDRERAEAERCWVLIGTEEEARAAAAQMAERLPYHVRPGLLEAEGEAWLA